jgi:hypothetical protein
MAETKKKTTPKKSASAPKGKGLDKLTKGKKYGIGPIQLTPFEWGAVGLGSYFIYKHFISPSSASTAAATDPNAATADTGSSYGLNGAPVGGSSGGATGGGSSGGTGSVVTPCGKGTHRVNGRCVPMPHICPPGYVMGPMGLHCVKAPSLKRKTPPPPHPKPPVRRPTPVGGPPHILRGPIGRPAAPHSTRGRTSSGAAGGGGRFVG